MVTEVSALEKFKDLKPWSPMIFQEIKKDLKQQHLKNNLKFHKRVFNFKPVKVISIKELIDGYTQEIESGGDADYLVDFIACRWVMKNHLIYSYFENELKKINKEIDKITEIDVKTSKEIVAKGCEDFGPSKTYIFVVLHSVAIDPKVISELKKDAEGELNLILKGV